MKQKTGVLVAVTALVGSLLSGIGGSPAVASAPERAASAATASEFDPGYIISNEVFFNANAMSEAQIQAFLQARVPSCPAANGVACLPQYTADSTSMPASPRGQCGPYAGAAAEPASRIIWKVAQACGINPQVLIVLLQKEQGLVTATSPTAGRYRIATGYGCPDTSACDAKFYGFFNQVYRAAWQFREYTIHPGDWRYRIGNVAVQYHPNAGCGAPVIGIRNQATANLYNYTPYQPNQAALANLSGTGDACSSYGNRNFWVYFDSWFGSPTGRISPYGAIDRITAIPGSVTVAGWAVDPDTEDSIDVHVYVDSVATGVAANNVRSDVGAHGFEATLPVSGGTHRVCVYGINVGPGSNVQLGCSDVTTPTGSPFGSLDYATVGPDGVSVGGWAIDPDVITPIGIHIYIDGGATGIVADIARADVATTYPGYGPAHGYSATIPVGPGAHEVCAYGLNQAGGTNALLGCKTVRVAGAPTTGTLVPFGALDYATQADGSINVGGWAIDPDTSEPIAVHIYLNASATGTTANQARADLGTAYPQYGAAHGFGLSIPAPPGNYTVCAYAINNNAGLNPQLGCRSVTTPGVPQDLGRAPFGRLDYATGVPGGISVGGWAMDPDSPTTPITVHVYVDAAATGISANQGRPDVAGAYPGYGAEHGYGAVVPATPGTHRVCIYGINTGSGPNPQLGCSTVVVP